MEKNNPKVLFVTEKWCDADPAKGLTNNYHNLFKTFSTVLPDAKFSIIHLDEYSAVKKKHIDGFLPILVDRLEPDVVVFSLLGKSHLNPTESSYEHIKSKGCKTVFMWPDMFEGWGIPQIEEFNDAGFADLHVCWGSERNLSQEYDNLIWLWAPQDETMYYPVEDSEKTINVSFLGSPRYAERQRYLTHLLTSGTEVNIGGGQREEGLPAIKYAELMRSSRINLNFPEGPEGNDQCKGRVWEILATKSLLLERANEATKSFLVPGEHYVEFKDENDLIDKINYYLDNPEERSYIAQNGYNIYKEKYNARVFWNTIMEKLG